MRKTAVLMALILVFSSLSLSYGFSFKEMKLSDSKSMEIHPAIYGSTVVWEDYRNDPYGGYRGPGIGNPDIYAYNISTHREIPICTEKSGDAKRDSAQQNPAIWKNLVVWEDWRNGNADIYIYDLNDPNQPENGTRLTFNNRNQVQPKIWGSYVVWIDYRNGLDGDVFIFNLSADHNHNSIPDWKEKDFDEKLAHYDMFPECLRTDKEFRNWYDNWTYSEKDVAEQRDLSIYGDIVVWKDYRNDHGNGNRDIYAYDIKERREFAVCTEEHNQFNPAIYRDIVVWSDMRKGVPTIWGKNLSSGKEFNFYDGNSQRYPSIWKNEVVWVERENNTDYLKISKIGGKASALIGKGWNQHSPSIGSRGIVWADGRDVEEINGRQMSIWKVYFLRTSNSPPTIKNIQIKGKLKYGQQCNITLLAEVFDPDGDNITVYAVSQVFGNTTLFDDGRHGDGLAGDGIYGANISIKPDSKELSVKIVAEDQYGAMTSKSESIPVEKVQNPVFTLLGVLAVIVVFLILLAGASIIRRKTRKELEREEK